MQAVGPRYGFGLYVHWPYCAKICPYCDFNVYSAKDRDAAPLVLAIRQDIERHRAFLPDHPRLDSLFLGGGTPSLLGAGDIEDIVETAHVQFGFKQGAEITIEANPNDIHHSDLEGWKAAGINRVSLGVQSLRDDALSFLGRDHNAASALKALESVQTAFDNHSLDLIYARPGQSVTDWETELGEALALGAPHLSLYELTIEERTAFGKRAARGALIPMQDDDQADLYEATQALCDMAGRPAYEVSNHASSPAFESRHNHIYWAGGDWIGVGPGAHGRLTHEGRRYATEAARRPDDYITKGPTVWQEIPTLDIARELLLMGLRPKQGLDFKRLQMLGFSGPGETLIDSLSAADLIGVTDQTITLTPAGRLLADAIAKQFAAEMNI